MSRQFKKSLSATEVSNLRISATVQSPYSLGKLFGVTPRTAQKWESDGLPNCAGPAAILLQIIGDDDPQAALADYLDSL